ncbi:MAG: hypothetical protein ACFBSD_12660 [Paracoccaceae bacterium]
MWPFLLLALVYGGGIWAAARALAARPRRWGRCTLLAAMPAVAIPAFAAAAAPFHYDGRCRGLSDADWACGLGEYMTLQAEFGLVLPIMLNLIYASVVFAMLAVALTRDAWR